MILFTADWHIKLGQKNVPVEWSKERYYDFFKQINAIDCSLHIVGGDIFDKLPSIEELVLFFTWVQGCRSRTIIYDGNHEATKKGKTFLTHLKDLVAEYNPLVSIVDDLYSEELFTIVPYRLIHSKGIWDKCSSEKVVFTHVRGEIPPHVKPEINLDLLDKFPTVYAGDLHSHSNTQRNIVYPGSPMTTSFHRSRVSTGYILINEDSMTDWSWHPLELPQLIRKTVSDPSEMTPTDYDHTIYELEGDAVELRAVKNTDLLDKKIVKRHSETALILDPKMTLEDELVEYLLYIVGLEHDKVKDILGRFNDYTSNIQMD